MLKTIAIVAVAAIGLLLLYAATRPDSFSVARSTTVRAGADKLYPLINDLHQFNTWNPYDKKDPNIRGEYRGPQAGPGAAYHFDGNKEVGKGSIQIVDSAPGKVTMQLHMTAPMEALNRIEFSLRPQGGGTEVTWAMHCASPFIGKLMGVFVDLDKMIGRDFEAGLADLKLRAERS